MREHLIVEGDRVRTIMMNRADKHNALSVTLTRELVEEIGIAQRDKDVRAVVLGAKGKNFCAGGDMEDFLASYSASLEQGYSDIGPSMDLFQLAFRLSKPLIVATKGSCRGGGVGLSALGHVTVSSPDATFALTELKLGLFPYGIFPLLSKNMGTKRSLELALSSRVFGASEAVAYGLVDEIADDPLQRALEIAESVAQASPYSVTSGIELYNSLVASVGSDVTFEHAGVLRLLAFKSEELAERVSGFLNKG